MKLKVFTVNDVRMLGPCYDPVTGLNDDGDVVHPNGFVPEDWAGTALDALKVDACPAEDRLWLVLRDGWIDNTTLRLFAVWCARQALMLAGEHDPRSIAACEVAERFATGRATAQELAAARAAANVAAWGVARDTTKADAWAAAWAAAEATAEAAVWAAWAAAKAAVWAARGAAEVATWPAVEAAVRESQVKHLIMMLESDED